MLLVLKAPVSLFGTGLPKTMVKDLEYRLLRKG